MPFRHITLVIALAITQTLTAAEVRLGAETPLAQAVEQHPAAFNQLSPSVASNGTGFLAVWADHREGESDSAIYASGLDLDGKPIQPFGQKLAQVGRFPHVASDGRDYVIVYHDETQSYSQRVDENAQPLGPPRALHSGRIPLAIASNGSSYLLLEFARNSPEGNRPVFATLLDRDGSQLQVLNHAFDLLLWVGARDGRYVLLDIHTRICQTCYTVTLHEIGDSGVVTSTPMPFINFPQPSTFSAVASEERVLVTWDPQSTLSSSHYMVFDYDGNVIQGQTEIVGPADGVQAAWDGAEFLITFRSDTLTRAMRVSPNGAPLDAQPVPLGVTPSRFAHASNGSQQMLVWNAPGSAIFLDVYSRAMTSFAQLLTTPETLNLVTLAGAAHLSVQIARGAAGVLAVWRDSNGAVEGILNGQPVTILPEGSQVNGVTVEAGKENFLVAWFDTPLGAPWRLFVRRVGLVDGRLLDAQPIPIFEGRLGTFPSDGADLTYDGSRFLLTWVAEDRVHMTLVNDAGLVVNHRSVIHDDFFSGPTRSRGVSTGTGPLVTYAIRRLISDVGPMRWSFAIERPDATGTDNDTPLPPVLPEIALSHDLPYAVAAGPTRVTFAWAVEHFPNASTLHVTQTTLSGQPIGEPLSVGVTLDGHVVGVELVWNGSEYVLVWSEQRFGSGWSVRAVRLDPFGGSKDATPIEIAEVRPASVPSIAVLPNGVMIGYLRLDALHGNVARTYTRTLERLPALPSRRRAVRK